MYRLMQINERPIPIATNFTPLFSPRRNVNRVEFISDFPDNDNAEVVSSLQVHPQGWCAVSRNISRDECTEVSSFNFLLNNLPIMITNHLFYIFFLNSGPVFMIYKILLKIVTRIRIQKKMKIKKVKKKVWQIDLPPNLNNLCFTGHLFLYVLHMKMN